MDDIRVGDIIRHKVRYEPREGAGIHTGRVLELRQLHNGEALVRIGRHDAPLCRVLEILGSAA